MGRKRKGVAIHGWLVIDKGLEISSNNVVGKVRWLLKAQKVGHGGTLDPLATGLLPIALGEATKTVSYVMDGTKTYQFTVTWGEARSTDDAEGEVASTSDVRPSTDDIQNALSDFVGVIDQIPPMYSAIKVDGKRAYALARDGQEVILNAREVRIDSLEMTGQDKGVSATFEMRCGKGTYVRSLARDLAQKLGTFGYVSMLRRTAVGPFTEDDAISLEKLEELVHSARADELIRPVMTVLDDIPALALTAEQAEALKLGRTLNLGETLADEEAPQGTLCAMFDDRLIALVECTDGMVRVLRGFNL